VSGSPEAPVAIEVRDVVKSFVIPRERQTTFKERALHPATMLRGDVAQLEALRGISFDVHRGEFFGVIGRNGGGKSTLLKLLASIYQADGGSIRVAGRLAPFIELGVGFNPELNARDNVLLNGVMMGLTRAEARSRFERVIDYAELWDYTDLKLKNYSFGMQVRLGFSMMLQVDADVLLVDEVLAVGDLAFQAKCIASLQGLKDRGTTIVLVTHQMDDVETHCDRAMLIEEGVVDTIGDPQEVAERFVEVILPTKHAGMSAQGPAGVSAAWVADSSGRPSQSIAAGDPFAFCATIYAREDVDSLELDLDVLSHPELRRISRVRVDAGELPTLAPGERATVRVEFDGGALEPAEYRLSYQLALGGSGDGVLDTGPEPIRLRIIGEDRGAGMVQLDHRVSVERGEARVPR
jgi:ABC-type polysaccharide/polyol phosphate transport system ATPase subunit